MRTARDMLEDPDDDCCRVCGTRETLSFEHLPPRSMGNDGRAEMLDMFQALAQLDGEDPGRGTVMQRGSGAYSLCSRCNERSGHLYVPELLRWGRAGTQILGGVELGGLDGSTEPAYVRCKLAKMRPGALLKQIATMMLALSPPGFAFHPENVELRDFAQDPDWTGLSDRFQFYLALFAGPHVRLIGGAALAIVGEDGPGATFGLELASPPFSYVMTVDEAAPPIDAGNISSFGDLRADQIAEQVEMDLLVAFGHTPFPFDFRSRASVEKCRANSLRSAAAQRLWLPDRAREDLHQAA